VKNMKKLIFVSMLVLTLTVVSSVSAAKPVSVENGVESAWENTSCATIQDGTIVDSAGNPLEMGYDQYGYNYQAHMFNGTYDSSDRVLDGKYWGVATYYADDSLVMKWSDEWLANVDCNGDNKLDRGLVNGTSDGISKGWTTNHVEGDYDGKEGVHHYTDFVKIVWTGPGSPLWGQYTVVEEVYNDPAGGFTGLLDKVGAPGFGLNEHWTE
jgi:hypothetical protein